MYALDDDTSTLRDMTDAEKLRSLIEQHVAETDSVRGKEILADWNNWKGKFKKIIPNDYLKIMKEIACQEDSGIEHEQAVLAAFKKCTA